MKQKRNIPLNEINPMELTIGTIVRYDPQYNLKVLIWGGEG